MAKKEKSKDEIFWAVLSSAMELDVKKGHLKWTLAELSRKSKITRSLIYYYFGRSKMEILNEAIKLIGEEFVGLSPARMKMWQEGRLHESMTATIEITKKVPYLKMFVVENITKENPVGEMLENMRLTFIDKIKKFYPERTEAEVLAIFSMYWGLSFAPGLTDESIDCVLNQFKRLQ